MLPEVVEAVSECLQQGFANPASQHGSGRAARRVLEQAREQIAGILGASMAYILKSQGILELEPIFLGLISSIVAYIFL